MVASVAAVPVVVSTTANFPLPPCWGACEISYGLICRLPGTRESGMISHIRYGRNWEFLPIARGGAPIDLSEWPSRRLRRKYNINETVQMNVRAPKAPPMMGPIGSFDSDFPCTKAVASPLAGVAPDVTVGLDEEDSSVENDEEDSDFKNDDEDGDNTGELSVVDRVVPVVELRIEVVRDDEGSPSLIVK